MLYLPCFISSPFPTFNLLSLFPCTNNFPFLSLLFPFHVIIYFLFSLTLAVGYVSAAFCGGDAATCLHDKSVPTRTCFTTLAPEHFNVCHPLFLYDSAALGSHGFLISEVSRSHSDTPHSVAILWTSPSQRLLSDNTQNSQEAVIIASGSFKPTMLSSERKQTHRLDRTANGIVWWSSQVSHFVFLASGMIYKIVRFNLEEWFLLEATNQSIKHLAASRRLEFANGL